MLKPRILVTGATGKTGSVVVAELLQAGYRVRAMVHRQDARSAQLRAQGADLMSAIRYYIDDHKRDAFEAGASTTDVLEVTGRPAEDFETIARRLAALPRNRRTLGNRVREFAEFLITPLRPRPNLDRYDRELRRPFPSTPQFALDSEVWRREHTIEPPTRTTRLAEAREMLA